MNTQSEQHRSAEEWVALTPVPEEWMYDWRTDPHYRTFVRTIAQILIHKASHGVQKQRPTDCRCVEER